MAALTLALPGTVRRPGAVSRAAALAWSTESILPTRLSLRLAHRAMPPRTLTRTIAVSLATGLPHREVRLLPLRRLAFRTRERGANQATMDGTVILATCVVGTLLLGRLRLRRSRERRDVVIRDVGVRCHGVGIIGDVVDVIRGRHRGHGTRASVLEYFLEEGARLLASCCRGLRLLVFVLGVTRRAPRLPDVVFNHRDDDMIGDAALARAVIVQNVTEPKPALLHELPRSGPFGWE